jgi:hypothetical protein
VSDETYSRVGSRIWLERWDDDTMLTALYLLTCKHRTTEGIYHLPLQYGATDKRWPLKRFVRAFDKLLADGFVEYDDDAQVLFIVNALKWQQPANPNQRKSALKKLRCLPATPLLSRFGEQAGTLAPEFAQWLDEQLPKLFPKPLARG